jgi:Leucine-rich repeat (LRR) protein
VVTRKPREIRQFFSPTARRRAGFTSEDAKAMRTHVATAAATFALLLIADIPAMGQELFPDKNLEEAVRPYVFAKRNNKEPLTADDVKTISTIVAKGKKITNLKGLEACTALALLDLENNEVADVTPIKDLKLIQSLDLSRNKIANIGPLAELTALQYLQLANNQIADIAPLAKFERLTALYLSNNQVADLKTVGELKKLVSLYLDGNKISDLTPLAGLTRLSTLDLRGCGVADLSPLKGLNQWQFLLLDNNQITDLGVLVEMATADAAGEMRFAPFWRIYLAGNPLSDAAKTQQVAKLKELGGRVFLEPPK